MLSEYIYDIKDKTTSNKYRIITIIITFIYFLFNLYLVIKHEPWRDEAQAWLISRDLSFTELFGQLKYEGHPFLWYLILMPFSKLGFPYITQNIISLIIMTCSVYLVLNFLPFNKIIRILLVFSVAFIYHYPVISRSYSLIALLIIIVGVFYPSRSEHPIRYGVSIALLTQTHVLVLGFVVSLIGLFFIEEVFVKRRGKNKSEFRLSIISIAIQIFGVLFLVLQLFGSPEKNAGVQDTNTIGFSVILKLIYSIIDYLKWVLSTLTIFLNFKDFSNLFIVIFFGLGILWIFVTTYYPRQGLMFLCGIGFQCFVNYAFYSCTSIQKALIIYYMVLFGVWTMFYDNPVNLKVFNGSKSSKYVKKISYILMILLICISMPMLKLLIQAEIMAPYSNSKSVSEYIVSELPTNSIIVTEVDTMSSAIAPYLTSQKLWNPINERYYTFVTWDDSRDKSIDTEEFVERIYKNFQGNKNVYLLMAQPIENFNIQEQFKSCTLLKSWDEFTIVDERYYFMYHVEI